MPVKMLTKPQIQVGISENNQRIWTKLNDIILEQFAKNVWVKFLDFYMKQYKQCVSNQDLCDKHKKVVLQMCI